MASGALILVSDLPAYQDLLKTSNVLFLCRRKDSEDLARQILHILDNRDKYSEHKRSASHYAREHLDWESICREYRVLLNHD